MAQEDLLVNIDVNTKSAKRGVDDLSNSLSENTKQTKKIQAELQKLEKEYKSIATAVNKLPSGQVGKLSKEVKKAERATYQLENQFGRTEQKMKRVKERTLETSDAFAGLATAVAVMNLKSLANFSGQIVNASQAILAFQKQVIPLAGTIYSLGTSGFEKLAKSMGSFRDTFKLVGLAVQEQKQIWEGYHLVQVRGIELANKFRDSFVQLSSGASRINRGLKELIGFGERTAEGFGRLQTLFRSLGGIITTTAQIVNDFYQAWFGTFGSSTAGAASINNWQKLMLRLGEVVDEVSKALKTAFAVVVNATKSAFASSVPFFQEFAAFSKSKAMELLGKGFEYVKIAGKAAADTLRGAWEVLVPLTKSVLQNLVPLTVELGKIAFTEGLAGLKSGFEAIKPALADLSIFAKDLAVNIGARLTSGFATVIQAMIKTVSWAINLGQEVGILGKGFFGALDNANVLGLGLLGLGTTLKHTDNQILKTIGSALQLAGVFTLSLTTATTLLIGVIGSLMISLGDKLFAVLDKWEEKFVKLQETTRAFEFAVGGFGKTLGKDVVGSVGFWNKAIDDMVQNTAFGTSEVQKSVKILVAEGSNLGLTAQQNSALLKRAGDIAAVTGTELSDVVLSISRGLAGNAASLKTLGIFVDEAAIEHSKYAKSQHLVVSALSREEKAQAAMNVLLEQTIPLVGGATNQLNTLAGANKQYSQSVELLQAKLGGTSDLFIALAKAQTEVVNTLSHLPTSVLGFAQNLLQTFAATLKITGAFVSMVLTLVSVKGAFELANSAVKGSVIVQGALNIVLGTVASRLGVQVTIIKNLSDVFKVLGEIGIAGTVASYRSFIATVSAANLRVRAFTTSLLFTRLGWATMAEGAILATLSVARFTVAILANPIFQTAATIVGGIYLVTKAFNELSQELTFLMPQVAATTATVQENTAAMKENAGFISDTLWIFKEFARTVVVGWLEIYKVLQLAVVGYQAVWNAVKGLFTDATARTKELTKEKVKLVGELGELNRAYELTFDPTRLEPFEKGLQKTSKALVELTDAGRGFSNSMKLSSEVMANLRIDVLGDEFDKANQKFRETSDTLNNLRNIGVFKIGTEVILPSKENIDKFTKGNLFTKDGTKIVDAPGPANAEDIDKAAIETERARLELIKLRIKGMDDLGKAISDQSIKFLSMTGKEVAAIRAKGVVDLDELDKKIGGQNKIAELQGDDLRRYESLRKAIQDVTKAEVEKQQTEDAKRRADELEKQLQALEKQRKTIETLRGQFKALNLENKAGDGDLKVIAQNELDLQLAKVDALEAEARKLGPITKQYDDILKSSRELAKLKYENATPVTLGDVGKAITGGIDASREAAKSLFSGDIFNIDGPDGLLAITDSIMSGDAFSGLKDVLDSAGEDIAIGFNKLANLSVADIAGGIGEGLSFFADAIGVLFDPQAIQGLADSMMELVDKFPDMLLKAFDSLSKAITRVVGKLPEIVSKLMDAVSGILSKIIDKIPALIDGLASAFSTFIERLPEITGKIFEALPAIIDQLLSKLPDILDKLLMTIGEVVVQMVRAIPGVLEAILNNLPDIIQSIIQGMIGAIAEILISLVDLFFGEGALRIAFALAKAWIALPGVIVKGIINGLSRAFDSIFKGFDLPSELKDLPNKISEGAKKLGSDIAKESSKIFAVKDLENAIGGLGGKKGPGELVREAFETGARKMDSFLALLKKAWVWVYTKIIQPLLDGIKAVWSWVYNTIIKPYTEALKAVWDAIFMIFNTTISAFTNGIKAAWGLVYDTILKPFLDNLKLIWDYVSNYVVKPLVDGLKLVWQYVYDYIVSPLVGIVRAAWRGVLDFFGNLFAGKINEAFAGVITTLSNIGVQIWTSFQSALTGASALFQNLGALITQGLQNAVSGLGDLFRGFGNNIWGGLKSGLDSLPGILTNMFNSISPNNLFEQIFKIDSRGQGTVEQALGIDIPFANFAQGGLIPGQALVAGDSEMNDRILALLSPGEAVIPRSKMEDPQIRAVVEAIIAGKMKVPKHFLGIPGTGDGDNPFGESPLGQVWDSLSGAAQSALGPISGTISSLLNNDQIKRLGNAINAGQVNLNTSPAGDIARIGGLNLNDAIKIIESSGRTVSGVRQRVINAADSLIQTTVSAAKDPLKALRQLNPELLWEKAKEEAFKMIPRMLEANRFHSGGMVPAFAGGTSDVPAMLQSGEFVINRQAVRSLGVGSLNQLNRGNMPGNQSFNFDIQLDVRADNLPDEAFIRQRMIPAIKKELKDSSVRGEFLMSSKGIRET